ncbi:peroxisomal succinyl-coenzyme A thioesterase [Fundulus heteroclitus]|uniref:peroxisomal succinyl-coenzyme A thioesterase n=1 Tax=Fundulus heteroclitus TaxID=8078 RepID=UPI00165CE29C|nr:peroxisomal succinyl-coenzyme A thioesterase [Fundulus heteroclitus]
MSLRSPPPILSVRPSRALVDEPFEVSVENLPPGGPVTVRSLHRSEDGDDWEAYGRYVSDHSGKVSVSEDLSFGGTFSGKQPMALLWSMRPVPGSRSGLRLRKLKVTTPMLVNISVYRGHNDFRDQTPLASAVTERWYMAPGVHRVDIRQEEVQGTLFIPPGPGPFPGVLDIWGGWGGLLEYRSALLASRGFASLTVEYLKPGELQTDLEFSSFEAAFNILKDHPKVLSDRVGVLGSSAGSIVTLYLAAESTAVQPRCVVCISNANCYPHESGLSGIQHLLAKKFDKIRLDENNHEIWRGIGLALLDDAPYKVDMGKIRSPVLLVNGRDDQNWPVLETADRMAQVVGAAGKAHLLYRLDYPNTGHQIEPPFSPHFRATNLAIDGTKDKAILLWGGETKAHSEAQEDSWKKILSFLRQHLYCSPKAKI